MKPKWYSSNFLNFLRFIWNFPLRIGLEWSETIIFIFSLSRPFPTNFCLKRSHNFIFSNFLNFFAISYEFPITHRVGRKRKDNFYFPCFSVYSNQLLLEMKSQWYFFLFFWNFLLRVRLERKRTIFFIFSIYQRFPPYFGLKWSHNSIL